MRKALIRPAALVVLPGALAVIAALAIPAAHAAPAPERPTAPSAPASGGTLYLNTSEGAFGLDPQVQYAGMEVAVSSAFLYRTLTAYPSEPGAAGRKLAADLATDTGTPSNGARTWTFDLRPGVTFEDGTAITCQDIRYGISRTFATDKVSGGPTYAMYLLDVPMDQATGAPEYLGPYTTSPASAVAAFNNAVSCSNGGSTITFRLRKPVGDFNTILTLPAFAPVQKSTDPVSRTVPCPSATGPYRVQSATGSQITLVRNSNWNRASDPLRKAYPDRVIIAIGSDQEGVDRKLMDSSTPSGRTGVSLGTVSQAALSDAAAARYTGRRVSGADAYVVYLAINADKVRDRLQRRAIAVALDRKAMAKARDGGPLADGIITEYIAGSGRSGLWKNLLGKRIVDAGDTAYATKLLNRSGKPAPTLRVDLVDSKPMKAMGKIIETSLEDAGFTVDINLIPATNYYSTVSDPAKRGHIVSAGWGADYLSASSMIEPLLTPDGGFNLSGVDDPAFTADVERAVEITDPARAADAWAALEKRALSEAWVVPLWNGRATYLAGTDVRGLGFWGAYCLPALGALWVK